MKGNEDLWEALVLIRKPDERVWDGRGGSTDAQADGVKNSRAQESCSISMPVAINALTHSSS